MSLFDKFNTQGMSHQDAFEELCCQLFETWGRHHEHFGKNWKYRNIRGAGGDGGIEAYWHNTVNDDWVGLQAKWFPTSLTSTQCNELGRSIKSAMNMRPTMKRYVVCIPHNLTSMKNVRGGKTTDGEEGSWNGFVEKVEADYPDLLIELWDENEIFNQIQWGENEGRYRFWFDHSLINPETIEASLEETIEALGDRYIPELTDDGGMSDFLDAFFGTRDTRLALVREVERCITLCEQIVARIASLVEVDGDTALGLRDKALACACALQDYSDWLSSLRGSLMAETADFRTIKPFQVDYATVEDFSSDVYDKKRSYKLPGHLEELDKLLDEFRETPSSWEITNEARRTLSEPHCIIEGDQGTGKTCGLASKAREYQQSQMHLPILVLASSVKDGEPWWRVVASAAGVGSDWNEASLWQALSSAAALHDVTDGDVDVRSKVAILVDGLDERPPSSFWEGMIRKGDAISRRYPRIRFAYSSRPSGIAFEDRSITECRYHLDDGGDVPAHQLFDRYIRHYHIDLNGNEQLKWLLNTPMELQMFCAAHQGRKVSSPVSTCLTDLVKAEIERLEDEFASRNHRHDGIAASPVRKALLALARTFLGSDHDELAESEFEDALAKAGLDNSGFTQMTELLVRYGILFMRRTEGGGSFDPCEITFAAGTRHLWDYFMAVLMLEDSCGPNEKLLRKRPDASEMLAILLVENKGMLPLDCEGLVAAVGDENAYELTLFALSNARPEAVTPFRDWVLGEMGSVAGGLSKVVNGLVIQVAEVEDHPFGPILLDEHLRTFGSPAERDAVWSLPPSLHVRGVDHQTALYRERDILKHMPRLNTQETSTQMPLVLAWGLSSVSNLKRRHCRSQLVGWGLSNPAEFAKLFGRFCSIDDPQIREDMFAIAEEIVSQGVAVAAVEAEIGRLALDSVFSEPDKPGNRDAALRFYGRIIVERCISDGLLDESEAAVCRPPYTVPSPDDSLPIFPDACNTTASVGYWPIDYDLARYVLVDRLASTFGIYGHVSGKKSGIDSLDGIIGMSASAAGVEPPTFEGWAIAAAYQYLLNHGYDPETFDADHPVDGSHPMGVDRAIRGCFYPADHGERSTVMTVAEKYIWCAQREICGYLADRLPVQDQFWYEGQPRSIGDDGLVADFGMLLNYDSPLLEATVLGLKKKRDSSEPIFPEPFSCNDSDVPASKSELRSWIGSADASAAIALLGFRPNIDVSIAGDTLPISLFANDWGVCGKESRVWLHAGVVDVEEIGKLNGASSASLDGYDRSSGFQVGYAAPASYLSPVELLASPWMKECDEPAGVEMVADAHVSASPLSGHCVASLIDTGDYFYDFPSELARSLCGVTCTDGCRYYDAEGKTRFEYAEFGTAYRHEYQALLADKDALMDKLRGSGKVLVWYATVQRDGTNLARERIPGLDDRVEKSWIIWESNDGTFDFCPASERERGEPQLHSPSDVFLNSLLSGYMPKKSTEDSGESGS